jgi:glycosyltransferase involved in cell wall biosynthesis
MNPHFVSVVIPTYNYGRYVTAAVDSALAQTYPDREILVIDDGSTDDTRDRLRPYLDRIRYIYQDNQGLSAARNTGIRAAGGESIALLDSDDLWHPRKLEIQVEYLVRSPEIGLVASADVKDLEHGWPDVPDLCSLPAHPVTLKDLLVRWRFGPSSVLVRKTCFDAVGLFDTELRSVEDRDMWIRIAERFPIIRLEGPLWWYRRHGANMTSAALRMEENEMKVLRRALDSIAAVRYDLPLRCKALSYALRSAAKRYEAAGMRPRAIWRVLQSMCLWPWPFRRDEASTWWERPKMLTLFLLRMLRGLPCGEARA